MGEAADNLECVIVAAGVWLAACRHVARATVIETWGSAPRRARSHLVTRDDGIFEGSVSGGCVEGDVIVQALELIAAGGGFRRLDYGVADAQAWGVGLERKSVVAGKGVYVRVELGGRRIIKNKKIKKK